MYGLLGIVLASAEKHRKMRTEPQLKLMAPSDSRSSSVALAPMKLAQVAASMSMEELRMESERWRQEGHPSSE